MATEDINNKITEAESAEYDKGYAEAIEAIKQALKGGGGGQGPQGPQQDPRLNNPPVNKNNQTPQGGGGQSKGNQSDPIDNMDADQAAAEAQNQADQAEQSSKQAEAAADMAKNKANATGSKADKDAAKRAEDAAKRAKDAAKKAKDAAKKASKAAKNGDADEAKSQAKEARNQANAAKSAAEQASNPETGKDGKEGKQGQNQKGGNPGSGVDPRFSGFKPFDDSYPTFEDTKRKAEKVINRYTGKISGAFGEFVRKCKTSKTERKKEGVVVRQRSGGAWNKQLDKLMNSFIKQEVVKKHREVELTYHRVKRGSRPVKFGQPIQPGSKIKDDKLNITIAFYMDRSGSMGSMTDIVFPLAYQLSDKILKSYKSESVVGDIGFRYFAFDDVIEEIKKGAKCDDRGGTLPMADLFNFIKGETSSDLINVVISDSQTTIDKNAVAKLVKEMPGMFFWISNCPKPECEDIQRMTKNQFVFIQADSEFTLQ